VVAMPAETSFVEYEYVHETHDALCVRVLNTRQQAWKVWIPKSLIVKRDDKLLGLPAWYARQKGIAAGRYDHV
jgi:hypothetical protein